MRGEFLLSSNTSDIDHDIYADKSSLILYWLLIVGKDLKQFSIREVARECNVSVGLVQRVFKILTLKGYLQTIGMRTAKKFIFNKSRDLLKSWEENYNIVKKCKIWTYSCIYQNKNEIIQALIENNSEKKVIFALHSAAEIQGFKNTNLTNAELYITQSDFRVEIEKNII
jgi:DNA-binding transcriptional regulator YhcF (GntR family)